MTEDPEINVLVTNNKSLLPAISARHIDNSSSCDTYFNLLSGTPFNKYIVSKQIPSVVTAVIFTELLVYSAPDELSNGIHPPNEGIFGNKKR